MRFIYLGQVRRGVSVTNKLKTLVHCTGRYLLNILILIDQTVNTLLGGDPDHTISGRVGYHATLGKPWALKAEKWINNIFFWQEDHCKEAVEWCIVRRDLREERKANGRKNK